MRTHFVYCTISTLSLTLTPLPLPNRYSRYHCSLFIVLFQHQECDGGSVTGARRESTSVRQLIHGLNERYVWIVIVGKSIVPVMQPNWHHLYSLRSVNPFVPLIANCNGSSLIYTKVIHECICERERFAFASVSYNFVLLVVAITVRWCKFQNEPNTSSQTSPLRTSTVVSPTDNNHNDDDGYKSPRVFSHPSY